MKYSFHEAAEREFFSAVEYYEECQSGLGLRFSEEVHATIERIWLKGKIIIGENILWIKIFLKKH